MTNLANQNQSISDQIIDDYLFSNNIKLSEQQKTLFKWIAKSFELNPFKREIYAVTYKDRDWNINLSIVTGYQTYIDKATASWLLDWREVNTDYKDNQISWATIVIYRKDMRHPFKRSVSLNEFVGTKKDWSMTQMWSKMPEFMIKKVAIWQWFRLAFPNELWGIPCLSEEITHEKENIPEVQKTEFTSDRIPKFIEWVESWKTTLADAMQYLKDTCIVSDEVMDELLDCIKNTFLDDINNLTDDTITTPETTNSTEEDVSISD